MPTVKPCLWFDRNVDEALEHWGAIFGDDLVVESKVPGPEGPTLVADFVVFGQAVMGLSAGPQFPPSESFSFFLSVDGQAEVDRYWDALIADGGNESDCGWCKDKFGFSWQVVPKQFFELLSSGTPEQSSRVMAAMNTMHKFDVAALQAAYDG